LPIPEEKTIAVKNFLLLIALATVLSAFGQRLQEQTELLDAVADHLLATVDTDMSYDELYEMLTHLMSNPVDLNRVTREQLRAIMLLNEIEIKAFLDYRDDQGQLLDVLELQAIPGWSEETIRRVMPFVTVTHPDALVGKGILKRMAREDNQYLVLRYERTLENKPAYREGDTASRYTGNPDRYYLRYRMVRANDFSVGLTAEKDPGENLHWSPANAIYGFDFYSGHLQLMRKGMLENLVIGDFQCQFGQGLQLGSVFGLGKTAQTITGVRRSNLGFLPYMSANESLFLRGLAASLRIADPVRVHFFGSQKMTDAVTEPGDPAVSSLQNTGLHRTTRELSSRGKVTDRDAGLVLQYRHRGLDAGVIVHKKTRSHQLEPDASPYNIFQFRGDSYSNVGAYANLSWSGVTLFTEFARTIGYGQALTAGLMGNLTSRLEMAWLYRDFDPDFFSTYANALSESAAAQNEQGLYWGAKYSVGRKLIVQGYLDYFRFPWLRYRLYRPSDGTERLLRIDYSPNRSMTFFVQAREEIKGRNSANDGKLYTIVDGTRRQAWISGEFRLPNGITLKARLQGSSYSWDGRITRGIAAIQEATWKGNRWSVTARVALFDTDDYDNRQYAYEKDVWLATSLPAYDGAGIRNYVLVHYSLSRHVDFWFRWARTGYVDRDMIGSGPEEITGNARNDVKFQVRIRP